MIAVGTRSSFGRLCVTRKGDIRESSTSGLRSATRAVSGMILPDHVLGLCYLPVKKANL